MAGVVRDVTRLCARVGRRRSKRWDGAARRGATRQGGKAGKGGVGARRGLPRRALREDASVPLSTCSRACLSRALSRSRSFSLLLALSRVRPRFASLPSFSHRVSPFSLPLTLSRDFSRSCSLLFPSPSLFLSLHLLLARSLGGRDRARPTPFSSHSHSQTHTHAHTHFLSLYLSPSTLLIRSRRFRLPSSSRRSESNRL